jgi:hypothetical protein
MLKRAGELCRKIDPPIPAQGLADGRSIEDYCLFEDEFVRAVQQTLRNAGEFERKAMPKDLDAKVQKSWEEHKTSIERIEKKPKNEKDEKEEKKERKTTGRWFKDVSMELIGEEASKVVLARNYCQLCREIEVPAPNRDKLKEAKGLCQNIASKLALPSVRAKKAIQTSE